MATLFPARLLSVTPEADALFDLRINTAGSAVAGSHVRPGQYALIALPDLEPQPFAIASAPGSLTFEFLVKEGTALTDALVKLHPNETVLLSPAQGPGFPLEQAHGRNLLLFATGSGISAIRSTLLSIRNNRDAFAEVTLFFGARTPTAFAYIDEHGEWENDRISVVRTVSQPGETTAWKGLTGYVQQHLGQVGGKQELAFMCGLPQMVDQVRDALIKKGIPGGDVFVNY